MRGFDEVRSVGVGRIIVKILAKLKEALKSPFVRAMETQGLGRARWLAARAVEWGYGEARAWVRDVGFIRYLALLDVNRPSGWGV